MSDSQNPELPAEPADSASPETHANASVNTESPDTPAADAAEHPGNGADATAPADGKAPGNGESDANVDANAEAETPLEMGTVIGGCRLEEKIGQGGMGAVYRATQIALEKAVALKVLARKFADNQDFLDRFLREARLAARLEHENIVQVFDTGTDAGHSYIVMQFVAGQTLRDRCRQGAIPIVEGLKFLFQAAAGLAAAHSKKVVHRDIKPENLMLTDDGHIKVADFGLAQETEDIDDEDPTRGVMASALYMSPEHADLTPVDARSDLYSLGVSFFTLFTGRRLFSGDNHIEMVLKHHLESPLPATLYRRDLPLTLAAVLHKLMQKRPAERYQSAAELLDDLTLISKRQLPKVDNFWSATSMIPPRLDAASIVKSGIKRCLDIQRTMKTRGDELLSLGQLMTANNFVRMSPASENRFAPDLPFLWPSGKEMPAAPNPYEPLAGEVSLAMYAQKAAEPGAKLPPVKLTRAPFALLYDAKELSLSMSGAMRDVVAVQHYYDLLLAFPFAETPIVTLWIGGDVALTIDDVPWLVDSHNLLKRRQGFFRVKCRDEKTLKFFKGHHLDQYLEVIAPDGQSVGAAEKSSADVNAADGADKTTPSSADSEAASEAAPTAGDEATDGADEKAVADARDDVSDAPTEQIPAVSPIDEARSLLATNNPLGAKQVLMPLISGSEGGGPAAEVKEIAREVAVALVDLGEKCVEAEDYDGAKDWFDHAISVSPNFHAAYFNKGITLKKLGQLEYSIRFFTEAIDLHPDDPEYFYNRAIVRARAGLLKESIADLDITVKLNARHANAYYNRGIAHEKLGDLLRAKQDYQLALKLNPKLQKVLAPRLKKLEQKRALSQNQIEPYKDGGAEED